MSAPANAAHCRFCGWWIMGNGPHRTKAAASLELERHLAHVSPSHLPELRAAFASINGPTWETPIHKACACCEEAGHP